MTKGAVVDFYSRKMPEAERFTNGYWTARTCVGTVFISPFNLTFAFSNKATSGNRDLAISAACLAVIRVRAPRLVQLINVIASLPPANGGHTTRVFRLS